MVFTESVVAEATLAWLESLSYSIARGPVIAPGERTVEQAYRGRHGRT